MILTWIRLMLFALVLLGAASGHGTTPGDRVAPASRGAQGDAGVDTHMSSRPVRLSCLPAPLVYMIITNDDDGTAVNNAWYRDGYTDGLNYIGYDGDRSFKSILRFRVPGLSPGDLIRHARLQLSGQGGSVLRGLTISIRGVFHPLAAGSPAGLADDLPTTSAMVEWSVGKPWIRSRDRFPMYCKSPDLGSIIDEILARPGWGTGDATTLTFILEAVGDGASDTEFVCFEDYVDGGRLRDAAVLEVFPTIWDAFVAKPMLGRPTDRSVTLNVMNLLGIDAYVEYGTSKGEYPHSTEALLGQPPGEPVEMVIGDLIPDTDYVYRLRYRACGDTAFGVSAEATFHTRRRRGAPFVFTIQADCHIMQGLMSDRPERLRVYEATLANIALEQPDFHIDLGDFANMEWHVQRDAGCLTEAVERYLCQRKYLATISHSVPFFLVIGNHEGEQGWRALNRHDSLEIWGTLARKKLIPNPVPDGFYTGNADSTSCCGLREAYYAWEWGDALFVVLDPFWYSPFGSKTEGPFTRNYIFTRGGWDWSLGEDQYEWFYATLHGSGAKWKIVFIHHLAGGLVTGEKGEIAYGRGGIDAVKFKVAGQPSFEWGGEDADGHLVFEEYRPGWTHGPIHDIMVSEGVDVCFRGHDHVFAYETLDGVVYQCCPVPRGVRSPYGFFEKGQYTTAVIRPNPGHLKVSVAADSLRVEYIRSVLPEQEPIAEDGQLITNGSVSYAYTLRK